MSSAPRAGRAPITAAPSAIAERGRVGQHVARVGEQRQRVRDEPRRDLDPHQQQDQRRARRRAAAAAPAAATCAVAVAWWPCAIEELTLRPAACALYRLRMGGR